MAKIEGPKGWYGRLAAERARLEKSASKPAALPGAVAPQAGDLPPKDALGAGNGPVPLEVLACARVPSKIAGDAALASSLKAALEPLAALGELTSSMTAWRERQFTRVLEQFYKVLAFQLKEVPEASRPEVAKRSIAALVGLIKRAGNDELLVPTTSAAIGLFDSGLRLQSRKKLKLDQAEASAAFEEASKAVLELRDAIRGRTGEGSAINTFAPLVEQLELGFQKLTQRDRLALFDRTVDFLAGTAPTHGVDLAMMARISELVAVASQKAPGQPDRILALAQDEFRAATAGQLAEAQGGLLAPPANIPLGPANEAQLALQHALLGALAASPSGPAALFQQVDRLRASSMQVLQEGGFADPIRNRATLQAASILQRFASSPAATELCSFFADHLPALAKSQPAVDSLARAAASPTIAASAKNIAQAVFEAQGVPAETQANALSAFDRVGTLPDATALEVSIVLLGTFAAGKGDAGLVDALVAFASSSAPDDPSAAFTAFAQRYVAAVALVPQYPVIAADASIPAEIARVTTGAAFDVAAAQDMLAAVQNTVQHFPLLSPAPLLDADSAGRPGMASLVDRSAKFVNPPAAYLGELLNAASGPAQGNKDLQEDLARIAMQIAVDAGHIHGGQALQLRRILADWTSAVNDPSRLHAAARPVSGIALRAAQQQASVASFLKAHSELPLDFALTAGIHLSSDQVAWAIDRIGKSRGRQTARALRDCVFGCVDANRLDLLEALRTTKSSAKAVSAVITEVAQYYRNSRAGEIPYDVLIRGLAEGGDPIAEQVKEKAKSFAGLDLNALAEGKVDPKGLQEILAISANVSELLSQYRPEFKSSLDGEIDMGALRPIFLECLKSVLQGTWPKPKYENEVGRRIMAQLTREQQAIWREPLIVPADQPAAEAANEAYRSAMQLVRGLAVGLSKEIQLGGPGLPALEWSGKSAAELRKSQSELLDQLHKLEKGSADHRALSNKLGVVNANLSVIDLGLALKRVAGDAAIDPKSALLEIRPALTAAQPNLRRMGGRGSYEAVSEMLDVAREIKSSPRQGRYTADEDGLTELIDSHKSGCLSYGDQRRRWGMAGALADPNIRMLRAYDGDRQTCRAFLKFFYIETEGYKGPALFMDSPVADGGGNNDMDLMYKHLAAKGLAMGVPVLGLGANYTPGWKNENRSLTFKIDDGNTGIMHSDNLFGGKGSIRESRGQNPTWDMQSQQLIAFPPTMKPQD